MDDKPTKEDFDRAIELANAIVAAGTTNPKGAIELNERDFELIICGLRAWAKLGYIAMGEGTKH